EISPSMCHLRTMRSKMKHLFPAFLLLLWSSGTVMGQFVNIRLELPAGVQFETQVVKTNLKSHGEEIIWMKMAAQENLTFLLGRSHSDAGKTEDLPIYYLNDGSDNFPQAERYSGPGHF